MDYVSSDQIPAVSVADLPADLSVDGAPLLVDVREPDEWSAGHIVRRPAHPDG